MDAEEYGIAFRKGEVHALAGENGAGKSTLIKMLTGAVEPSAGEIIYDGQTYTRLDPLQAVHCGIATVYQEFNLIRQRDHEGPVRR